jgi:hypothetical protein
VRLTGQLLMGVTTAMSNYLLIKRDQRISEAERAQTAAAYAPLANRRPNQSRAIKIGGPTGTQRGSLVHEQMEHLILLDRPSFMAKYPEGLHVWTALLMRDILDKSPNPPKPTLQPFKPEFVFYDILSRLACKVDNLSLDESGIIHFIEYKTGSNGVFYKPDPSHYWRKDQWARTLAGSRTTCTPFDQAVIQVTLCVVIARRLFALEPGSFRVWVARIADDTLKQLPDGTWIHGTEFYQVPIEFINTIGEAVYAELVKAHAAAREEKTAAVKSRRGSKTVKR